MERLPDRARRTLGCAVERAARRLKRCVGREGRAVDAAADAIREWDAQIRRAARLAVEVRRIELVACEPGLGILREEIELARQLVRQVPCQGAPVLSLVRPRTVEDLAERRGRH